MTKISYIFWIICFLTSCISTDHVVRFHDQEQGIDGFILVQKLRSVSKIKSGNLSENKTFQITTKYLFEEKKSDQSNVVFTIWLDSKNQSNELDSTMFLILDGEKIQIISEDSSSKSVKNDKLSKGIRKNYIIPENIWISIVHSNQIGLRLNQGKEEIEVKLSISEITCLKDFFNRAIHYREKNFQAIPEGKKKW